MLTFGTRVAFAFRCFFALLFRGMIPADILTRFVGVGPAPDAARAPSFAPTAATAAPPPAPEPPADRAVQLLALFQRDGRLVDFLREDITGYADAQIGAAVRDVHENCRRVLDRYLPVEPILAEEEGRPSTVTAATDPSAVKVVGQVAGAPPYRGTVRHRGWRVAHVALPPPVSSGDLIVAPGEVEVG